MMDVFIKSFNRAYYLDRAIYSLKKYLVGEYQITVLDDGTPQRYLDKIKEKYPEVRIIKSENYAQKSQLVTEGKRLNGFQIPTQLWYDAVKNGSEYCIVTEDDVWFSAPISLNSLVQDCKNYDIQLLKLGWLTNFQDDQWAALKPLNEKLVSVRPKGLFLAPRWLMNWLFYNRYKFFSAMYKLRIFDNYTKLKYWHLNSILMGLWNKKYWLKIWENAQGVVDEKQQLVNAAAYYRKHQNNPNFVARLTTEAMKTTFQSSSTNSYHEYGYQVDVDAMNRLLNEAWYRDELNPMQNFPKDFKTDYLISFFDDQINSTDFRQWATQFKNQYRNLGCEIEE